MVTSSPFAPSTATAVVAVVVADDADGDPLFTPFNAFATAAVTGVPTIAAAAAADDDDDTEVEVEIGIEERIVGEKTAAVAAVAVTAVEPEPILELGAERGVEAVTGIVTDSKTGGGSLVRLNTSTNCASIITFVALKARAMACFMIDSSTSLATVSIL